MLRKLQRVGSSCRNIHQDLSPLNYRHYWYPVALKEDVNNAKPFAFKIFGEPHVLYRNNEKDVQCLIDKCPHRSVPLNLSLGRVTNGNLECAYHGWQFGNNGKCVHIPAVDRKKSIASSICAKNKPVHEEFGYVWVWPGPAELADTSLIPRDLFKEHDAKKYACDTHSRSCPLDHNIMVDGSLDIAHLNFAHHGTLANRKNASSFINKIIDHDG
jgi:phenylpropionate dioxygenase-like ring-hydroxylating dioxygenase large terminal subunit